MNPALRRDGDAPLEAFTSHFANDLRARVAKLAELALLILIARYCREP